MELETAMSQLRRSQCQVLLVFFGSLTSIQQWLEQTKTSYPAFQDPSKHIYSALGLKRSIKKVYGIDTIQYYSEELASGTDIPTPYENYKEDVYQMGGDFIIDCTGQLLFTYRSQTVADRPSVKQIVDTLKSFPI
ncbi:uncharacterized protein LOC115217480 isoform X4 [Argonauta hians]